MQTLINRTLNTAKYRRFRLQHSHSTYTRPQEHILIIGKSGMHTNTGRSREAARQKLQSFVEVGGRIYRLCLGGWAIDILTKLR